MVDHVVGVDPDRDGVTDVQRAAVQPSDKEDTVEWTAVDLLGRLACLRRGTPGAGGGWSSTQWAPAASPVSAPRA